MKRFIQSGLTLLTILVLLFSSVSFSPRASAAQDGSDANYTILLQYGTIDTRQGEPAQAAELTFDSFTLDQPGYYIVQFTDVIQQEWRDSLEATGAKIFDYIPNNAYLVGMTSAERAQVAALPNVQWVGVYQPAYRVSPMVNSLSPQQNTGKMTILTFPGAGLKNIAAQVQAAGVNVLEQNENEWQGMLVVAAPPDQVPNLAKINGVMWIEPRSKFELTNSVARGIMDVEDTVWGVQGLYGAGQVVGVADTGLDVGPSGARLNADFEGRVVTGYGLGRVDTNDWSDPDGHGTHVSGSVLGSGRNSGSNPATHSYTSSHAGLAPEARLVMQSVMDYGGGLGGIPSDLNTLFQQSYNAGARIHTNSWGAPVAGAYNVDSRNADIFMWNHPDFTILFSAGNSGTDDDRNGVVDPDSIGTPGTAKNVITVGASENNRSGVGFDNTYGFYWYSRYAVSPISSDFVSNNINGMAAFSSRGPTDDGRIKPDVVAPGTNILSVKSSAEGAGSGWGELSYGDPYSGKYIFMGGTSMSTPLTAGGAALIREYFVDRGRTSPSAALIKATMVNGAVDMTPGQYGIGAYTEMGMKPNNVEGFGRVNLQESLFPAGSTKVRFEDVPNASGLTTSSLISYTYNVTSTSVPFRATMTYTDYPGATYATKELVNDLDLTVVTPGGITLYPNNLGARDSINNVEDITIPVGSGNLVTGTYTVTVRGYSVPSGPQGFGLAVRGGFGTVNCYTLNTNVLSSFSGTLSFSPAPNCGANQYTSGTNVSVTAIPSAAYRFTNWSGSAGGTNPTVSTAMNGDRNIAANFETQKVFVPIILRANPSQPFRNGNFEAGAAYWTQYQTNGYTLIRTSGQFPTGITPHGGSWAAWTGGDLSATSYIQQTFDVPSTQPYLAYWVWTASEDICNYDFARMYIIRGGITSTVDSYTVCSSNNTGRWVKRVINLSGFAGSSVTMKFQVTTDESLNSNVFLDDFAFQATSSGLTGPDTPLPGGGPVDDPLAKERLQE